MTILVTGGTGYIGSHTVRELVKQGRDVVVLDSLVRSRADSIPSDIPLIVGDVGDRDLITDTCRRHQVTDVIHFAALKSVGESMQEPGRYWRNNVASTSELIEGMLHAGVGRIVFSSSASVYGNPERVPVTENAEIRPENVYAETKAIMERIIAWYAQTRNVRYVSLRYFNAAGASLDSSIGENWDMTTNLIPLVMKASLGASGPVTVFGDDYPTPDGTGIRDYIHVEDLARAHVRALEHLESGGDPLTVNLGTGHGSSVHEVLAEVERVAGTPVPHRIAARRVGDPAIIVADAGYARDVLGWEARHGLREIVETAYRWHAKTVAQRSEMPSGPA